MRQALNDGGFELHYQPQVRLVDENVIGFEALLRWRHFSEGWISPAEIIPIAESTGFIVEIGRWALHTACVDALSWGGRRVAVNISGEPLQAARLRRSRHARTRSDRPGSRPS